MCYRDRPGLRSCQARLLYPGRRSLSQEPLGSHSRLTLDLQRLSQLPRQLIKGLLDQPSCCVKDFALIRVRKSRKIRDP